MVGVEEGCEYRFRGDLYSQESTFPLVITVVTCNNYLCEFLKIPTFYRSVEQSHDRLRNFLKDST